MNEFVLLDAAVWQGHPSLDALMRAANAVPLYADLPSANASRFGPWLLEAGAFDACVPGDDPRTPPWRYGVSRLAADASLASLTVHLESQRSIAMADGDRYYLRYADTRAMDALTRVLTPAQTRQLKGPVAHWRYLDRFGDGQAFGAKVPPIGQRQPAIVLSEEQAARLLEHQLAGVLADEIAIAGSDLLTSPGRAEAYRHVEKAAAFVLAHSIEPLEVQRHIAAMTVKTDGALLADQAFLDRIERLRGSARWHELLD